MKYTPPLSLHQSFHSSSGNHTQNLKQNKRQHTVKYNKNTMGSYVSLLDDNIQAEMKRRKNSGGNNAMRANNTPNSSHNKSMHGRMNNSDARMSWHPQQYNMKKYQENECVDFDYWTNGFPRDSVRVPTNPLQDYYKSS
jgi:hypothetical protein